MRYLTLFGLFNSDYLFLDDVPTSSIIFYNNVIEYQIRQFTIIISDGGILIAKVRNIRRFIEFINHIYPKLVMISIEWAPNRRFSIKRKCSTVMFKIRNDISLDKKYSFLNHSVIYKYGEIKYK